jgi:hypothetical protein
MSAHEFIQDNKSVRELHLLGNLIGSPGAITLANTLLFNNFLRVCVCFVLVCESLDTSRTEKSIIQPAHDLFHCARERPLFAAD